MNKIIFLFVSFMLFASLAFASAAENCDLTAKLINQDPYPAIPGDYVQLLFQIDGVSNSLCGQVYVELPETYPIEFDPGVDNFKQINSGVYAYDYKQSFTVPFKVRIDKDALDGDTPFTLRYATDYNTPAQNFLIQNFTLKVEDVRTDFEVSVKDYDSATQTLTFEILNTGKNDVEAVTIDIPTQAGFEVKGSSRNIIGSLDSNDDTTFTFEGTPHKGDINMLILYTDNTNERRTVETVVYFDPSYFEGRVKDKPSYTGFIIAIIVIALIVIYFFYRRHKKKKRMHELKHSR